MGLQPHEIETRVELAFRPGADARLNFLLIQGPKVPCSLRLFLPSASLGDQIEVLLNQYIRVISIRSRTPSDIIPVYTCNRGKPCGSAGGNCVQQFARGCRSDRIAHLAAQFCVLGSVGATVRTLQRCLPAALQAIAISLSM